MAADSSSSSSSFVAKRSKEPSPDRPVAQPPRLKYACEACHQSKVRCTGEKPCSRCTTNGWGCVYKLAARIGKPKGSRNKATIQRLRLEAEQQAAREGRTSPVTPLPMASPLSYQGISTPNTGDVSNVNFDPSYATTPISTGSGTQDWMWPADNGVWPHSPESIRNASLPSHAVSSPESQWGSMMDGDGSSTSRSLSDATVPISGLSLPPWESAYNVHGEPHGSGVTSTLHELFPGAQALAYSITELPSTTFLPHTTAYDSNSLNAPLLMDDQRQSSPFRTWTSAESLTPTMPATPPAGPGSCSCRRNLSWQLSRLDQLRKAVTTNMGVRDFVGGTTELRQAIGLYMGCHVCEKDHSGLSLVTTAFANFTHVLLSIVRESNDPIAQAMRDGSYNWLSVTSGNARMGSEQLGMHKVETKMLIDQWVEECEMALQIARSLTVTVEPSAANLASHTIDSGQKGKEKAKAATISWSAADPTTVEEMLWRVKQSLTNLV